MSNYDLTGNIIAFEEGELEDDQVIELFVAYTIDGFTYNDFSSFLVEFPIVIPLNFSLASCQNIRSKILPCF